MFLFSHDYRNCIICPLSDNFLQVLTSKTNFAITFTSLPFCESCYSFDDQSPSGPWKICWVVFTANPPLVHSTLAFIETSMRVAPSVLILDTFHSDHFTITISGFFNVFTKVIFGFSRYIGIYTWICFSVSERER